MKLFVVGEDSPDPDKWSIWSEFSLVLAPDEDAARELADALPGTAVCEIPLDKAVRLVKITEPEYTWGDDT